MIDVKIRRVVEDDLPELAALWHERMMLRQQVDRRLKLAPDGRTQWMMAAKTWLADEGYCLMTADYSDGLAGYIIGRVEPAPPGVLPVEYGAIIDIAVGVHTYQSGLGRRLFAAVQSWFIQQGLSSMIAYASPRNPVEDAFWRASGATVLSEVLWLKL